LNDSTYRSPRARSDVGGLGADCRDPLPQDRLGDELEAVVGADVARYASEDEQIREHVDGVWFYDFLLEERRWP